ncbi:MAG: ArnT family glycosyltransferase, partial [Candidatus Limisoma sp.]
EILALFRWYERGLKGMPWLAALLASGAILTKGPVGVLLPAIALGLFLLADGRGLKAAVVCGFKLAIPSLVLPALWYLAAYRQGGEQFLDLVLEENVGRFLGKMTYESHEHSPFYTIPMLLSGLLPFTLLLVFCLPVLKYRSAKTIMERIRNGIQRFRGLDAWHRYAAIVAALIFVFYCIPKSKRGVYLLPMYPFVALLVADAMMWAYDRHRRVVGAFAGTMTAIAGLLVVAMSTIRFIDPQMLGTSRSARRMASQLTSLQAVDDSVLYIASIVLLVAAIVTVIAMRRHRLASIVGALLPWICTTIAIDAAVNPAIKNSVPDYDFAMKTRTLLGGNPAYYFCADDEEENVFTVDFYLDDRVEEFRTAAELPAKGYIFFKEHNLAKIDSVMEGVNTQKVLETPNEFTCFKGKIYLYRFEKR